MSVQSIPDSYHSLTAAIATPNAHEAIAFYEKALGATTRLRLDDPNGKVAHAELQIGDSCLMISEEFPQFNNSPQTLGGSTVVFNLYVQDVEAAFAKAIAAGATELQPIKDQFFGDRSGRVKDPYGFTWILSTHIEDVTPEEMQTRMDAMYSK